MTDLQNSELPRTVLVTGGAGFIGSALVRYLLTKTTAKVVNVDKMTYAANPLTLETLLKIRQHQHIQGDICDAKAMADIIDETAPDIVIHLAAESHVDRSIDGPADFVRTNILGTYTLLEVVARYRRERAAPELQDLRFVNVSTDEVYGSLGPDKQFFEESAYNPNSPYAATKAAADHLTRAWHTTYGLETIVTNASNNYGPYQFPEKLIPRTIIRALLGQPIEVYGQGTNVRDWIHVDDHAEALWLAAVKGRPGRTYNIGAESECQNLDLVRRLCAILDDNCPEAAPHGRHIAFVADRPGHDHRYALNPSRIQKELGWQPSISFDDGLRSTVGWYLENRTWWEPLLKKSYDGGRLGQNIQ